MSTNTNASIILTLGSLFLSGERGGVRVKEAFTVTIPLTLTLSRGGRGKESESKRFNAFVLVVTPVKTGVQKAVNFLKSRSERDWIPAFAGMTGK